MIFADVEADNLLPGLTKIHCIAMGRSEDTLEVYADAPGYKPLATALRLLKSADKVAFHNGLGYDYWAINKLFPGTLRPDQIVDTMVIMGMRKPGKKHSIEMIGRELGFPKGSVDSFEKFTNEMAEYCMQDVRIMLRMWPKIEPYYLKYRKAVEIEFKVAEILARQSQHGFRLDVEKAQSLELAFREEMAVLEKELQKVFPPITHKRVSAKTGKPLKDKIEVFNPGSRLQIAQRFMDKGWKPTKVTDKGNVIIDDVVLDKLSGQFDSAKPLARYFRLQKQLGQVVGWLKAVDSNGYVHGFVNQTGTRTHRMSHSSPNMAQVDKDPDMRSCWLPDKGHVLVGADAEGLELRTLAHYLYRWDNGAFGDAVVEGDKDAGTDAHTINQKAVGLFSRNYAKNIIYCAIYGGGDPKMGEIILEDAKAAGKPRPKGTPKGLGRKARSALMGAIEGYSDLSDLAKAKHNERNGVLIGLDGRPVISISEHSALNTLLQSAGAIVMKWAMVIFDKWVEDTEGMRNHVHYVANVHDELQMSCRADVAEEVGKQFCMAITAAGIALGVKCKLEGAYDIGRDWSETH